MSEKFLYFNELRVWQQAVDLVATVYVALRLLPKTENFALGDQLREAVVSVAANIAEGQPALGCLLFPAGRIRTHACTIYQPLSPKFRNSVGAEHRGIIKKSSQERS